MVDINSRVFEVTSDVYRGYKNNPKHVDEDIRVSYSDSDNMCITIISNGYITEFKISQNHTFSYIILIDVYQYNLIKDHREKTLISHNVNTGTIADIRREILQVNLYNLAEFVINLLIKQGETKNGSIKQTGPRCIFGNLERLQDQP